MKPPLLFQSRRFQDLLIAQGTREQIIGWLMWNNPSGVYSDEDSRSEGYEPLTLDAAREIMREQVNRE